MNAPQPKKCTRCKGCGQLANTIHGEPWADWLDTPPIILALVTIKVVKPIPCFSCGGTGEQK